MFKCRLNSTKKVIRILICHILILSMFFSVVSPSNAEDQGFDAANGVAYSQEHLRGVLEADLSQYQGERIPFDPSEYEESQPLPKNEDQPWEGERTPDAYDIDRYGDAGIDNMSDTGLSRSLSDISTANEASDSGVGSPYDTLLGRGFTETGKPISRKELWQDQTYETDRFIVKYKENASRETVEASLLSSNLVEAVDKISKFDNPQAGLKGEILKNNGSQISRGDVASIEDFASILKTHEAITAEDLTRRLDDAALLEIEYIQPDYEMAFYSLGEEEPFGNIEDDESLTIGQDDPPDLATTQDNGIVVALLDTGIDTNHPALAGKLTAGYDFVNNTENVNSEEWYYDQGHGTSLAGVIASAGAA
ncbi:MAG: S8 family serine peptidase, partial [Oscillospiraceae bacterium]|nr:S8 family serine peptidase [Oscillospiraceae bacterium]